MEEKESSFSGSPGNPDSGSSPQPLGTSLPQVMKMDVVNSGGAIVAAAKPPTTAMTTPASGGQGSFDLFGKKKRGRPRKYDADGNLRLTSSYQGRAAPQPPPGFSFSSTSPSHFSSKRGRGRPLPSSNFHLLASLGGLFANTAGGDFIPHVVTVHTGEDVAGKILSFAQNGPRGICILSANGAISNVTMRQPSSSGGLLTYEGRFEILSLSGSFTINDNGSGIRSRTGGLSVSLAGPDGRVIGGGVAGLLRAASPIQIVMGSFMPNGYNYKTHKKKQHREHTVASPDSGAPDTGMAARPLSQANPDGETCLTPAFQMPRPSQRESEGVTSDKQNIDATPDEHLNNSENMSDQKPYPDINISLPPL